MSTPLDLIRLMLVELMDDMNGDSPDTVDSQSSATSICNMALADLKDEEIDMATSLLFNPDRGITSFLQKSLDKTVHVAAKVTFLEFTGEFIERYPQAMTPYIVDIKRICQRLFLNDHTAKVQKASMIPIKLMLSSCSDMIDSESLDMSGYFTKLFTQYGTQQSKMATTVKAQLLEVLGTIAHYFPQAAEERISTLTRWCLTMAQEQLKKGSKMELTLLTGAVVGLDNCLFNFADKMTKEVPAMLQLIRTLVNVPEDLSRFATPIGALNLFAHHIHLFRSNLIEIYEWMYQKIASFCEHSNKDMSKCGYRALDVFLKEMAKVLTVSPTTEREYNCFLFFTANFTQIMSTEVVTSDAQYKAMSVAIRGYGYFAAPCKQISPDQLRHLLAHLLKKSSFLVSSNADEGFDGSSSHLSAFITAYTYVARVYDDIPEQLMAALHQMTNAAIVNFTKMGRYSRTDCANALEKLLIMLFHKGEGVLWGFLEKCFYKLLVFTSSDITNPNTGYYRNDRSGVGPTWHSYTMYLTLWQHLFKPTSISEESSKTEISISKDNVDEYLRILYGSTMESFRRILSLLNLSVTDIDRESESDRSPEDLTSPESGPAFGALSGDVAKMQANCAKDFVIFQNLTEFWQIFLPSIRPEFFGRWAFLVGETLIELSAINPLVSGFYKLFASCLQVCQNISLFSTSTEDVSSQVEVPDSLEIKYTAMLFKRYIAEVLARLEQYKDDLLASCLHLVLSSPLALTDSESIIPPIQLALKLGLGYFPLASIGLDAIERWAAILEQDQDVWFGKVLPSLNEYLLVQISTSSEPDPSDGSTISKTKPLSGRKKSAYSKSIIGSTTMTADHRQSVIDLQLRILRLLGRQAGHNKLILGHGADNEMSKKKAASLLAWDPEPRVKFKIPFQEMKTEVQFDEMLPRVVDLAENSLNRQIKVASCELLHSLVILMIGSSAFRLHDSHAPKKSPFHKIYLKVFPALLRLAVDVDQVPRSLFRPLLSQLIHWLTSSAQYENPETIALLNCCMDAACDTLGPLRDYGAECLGEFVQWSIKQSSSKTSSFNVKSLLKRIYNLASHSNPAKRLGASLIVNRIYRVFREEATLVNQFTLELLYWMLFSLRLAEADPLGLGTRQQACTAIGHLQKIIQKKADVFLKDSKDRRPFPGLGAGTLESLIGWLLKETSRLEIEYARMCRALFDSFVKLLPGGYTPGSWVGAKLVQNPRFLSSIHKEPAYESNTLSQPSAYQKWCAQLAAILKNYMWLLEQPGCSDLLVKHIKSGSILETLAKFLKKCVMFSEMVKSKGKMAVPLTALEKKQIMEQNFIAAMQIIALVSLMASKGTEKGDASVIPRLTEAGLFGSGFFTVFAACLFNPDSIGDNELLKSEEESSARMKELENGLKIFSKLPKEIVQVFGKISMQTLEDEALNPLILTQDLAGKDPIQYRASIEGLQLLQRCGMLEHLFEGSTRKTSEYILSLYDTFMTIQKTQDPLWIQYGSALLRLTMQEPLCHKRLWRFLLDDKNSEDAKMTYQKYADEINRQLALHFEEVAPVLLDSSTSADILLNIWNDFLSHLFSHAELNAEKQCFLDMLTKDHSVLERIVNSLDADQISMKIAIWKRIVALSPRILRMSKSTAFVDYFFKIFQSFFERDVERGEYLSLPVMSEAFSILPLFLSYSGSRTTEFENVFNRAIMNVMPSSSTEFERGSSKFNDYILALDLLLKALIASSSMSLFKILMGIAIRESNHPHMERMQMKISSFALQQSLSKFLEIAGICFEGFIKRMHSDIHRRNIVHQVLLPILRNVPPLYVSEFFVQHISSIMTVIKQEPPRAADSEIKRDYIERGCCFDLVHILYMRLPAESVNTKESKIVGAFTKGKTVSGKELTLDVFKSANVIKRPDQNTLSPEAAVFRDEFKRAAYNALAAGILCTQSKENFFRSFLFRDNEEKKEFVWESIVDVTAQHHFEQVLSGPAVRTQLSDLRSKSINADKTYNPKHQYMSSYYLRDSSLSQSIGVLDGSKMFAEDDEKDDKSDDSSTSAERSTKMQGTADTVASAGGKTSEANHTLELDAINANPCMKMVLLIINELHNHITPPPAELCHEEGLMPAWMRDIHRKLVNPSTSLNVRLFLAKVVINMPEAFEIYANSWIRPLMKLAMEGERYGEPMNYFVQDLCVLVVVWGASVKLSSTYDDRVLLLNFLSYLMKHCHNMKLELLRNNIEIIKGVFANWSNVAIVPTPIIYNNFSNFKDDKKNVTGIQLLGIVLTHDKAPFYAGPEIAMGTLQEDEYYEALVRNLGSNFRNVYESTSEVCGLILAYMKRHNCMNDNFVSKVISKLSEFLVPRAGSHSKNGTVIFLSCLHKIQLNYSAITETFSSRVLFLFPRLLGEERKLALEILAGRAAHIPDLFTSIQGLNFLGCLKYKDEPTQFAALSIIYGLCGLLKASEIHFFMDTIILEFSAHSSVECRKLYFSVLMVLYEKHTDDTKISGTLRVQLLRGLGDPIESIRHTVVEFWYGKNRLPQSTFYRLGEIVRNMYDAQAEDKFLNYATYMLLDRTKNSSDYNEPIFSQSLPHAKFGEKYADIDTSWRSTAAMTPLFVHTQQSQSQPFNSVDSLGADELRATQATFDFSMTMDGGTPGIRSQLGGNGSSSSTLLFKDGATQNDHERDFRQLSLASSNQKYHKLQMRHYQSEQTVRRFYANRHDYRTQTRDVSVAEKEMARLKNVSIIRKYRDGDLPDIQISYSDIIRPLQKLAELDVEICRMLFSKLVTSLIMQVESHMEMSEEEAIMFKETLIVDFKHILEKSTFMYTPFIGCILRICHDYGEADMPAELISKVAIRSSNQHLGIILVEKQIQFDPPRERSLKRQKVSEGGMQDPKRKSWIELARIYKSIDEKDVFKSIYESRVATTEFTKQAIEAEVMGDFDKAVHVYFEGITEHFAGKIVIDDAEQSIWAHGRLECLEMLGDWEALEGNTFSDLEENPNEAWSEDYQDPYLYYYLTSYIKLYEGKEEDGMLELWSAEKPNPLFEFVDNAMNNPERRSILTSQFQPELALTAVIRKDFKQASHYVRKSYDRFLSNWSNLHPLSVKPRLHELSNLQRIVELEEFLACADAVQRTSASAPLLQLLMKWDNRYPGKTNDTIVTWNNILGDRKLLIERLEEHIPYSRKLEAEIGRRRIQYYNHMSAAAREQGNFTVANYCIASMRALKAPVSETYNCELKLDLAKAVIELDQEKKAKTLVQTLARFDDHLAELQNADEAHVANLNLLGSRAFGMLHDVITSDSTVLDLIHGEPWIRSMSDSRASNKSLGIAQALQKRGFDCLQSAAAFKSEEKVAKKLRLTTAKYCDKILRFYEGDDALQMSTKEQDLYATLVIKNTLLSMRDEGLGADELFPRLLQIIEKYPTCQKLLKELVSDFPNCWAFVRWIPQMVAILDKAIAPCVVPVLKAIARQYPNALYYPLTISAENYTFERNSVGEKRKEDVTALQRMIRSPLKEDFIFELRRLTNAEHLMKDWLEQTIGLLQKKSKDEDQILGLFQDLHRLILDSNNPRLGSIARAFAAKHGSKLESYCGKTGSRLLTMSNKDFNATVLKYVRSEILAKEAAKKAGEADLLKSYSPWLHSFQSSDFEETIDIPGQDTGLSSPHGQTATIVRFDQRVLVMSSIRKPKRISILGSDEREHLFLVKGGEDLRLDQRIQQLFSLMNDIMRKDPQCAQQNMSIATYKVIPMSGSLGILEWVDNTKPLRHCIEEIATKDMVKRTQEQYNKFVASFKGDMMGYHNLFIQGTRDKVVKHMESLRSHLREDYLRQSISRLASSPEAFLMLRSEFAKSLAAINVCSYILGIGDRHLENFLLDMSNGCLIPIDFGHAFGSATECLPVPELVPFRLTRQLEAFLNPLGAKGLLEHPMVCIMRALQGKKDVILNTMDVFVKEPLLDWRKFAINQAREQKKRGADMDSFEVDEDSTAPPAWYLQQKMDIARKKLEGYNPTHLTVMELNMGHANKPFLMALTKTALGDKQYNVRARHDKICTSVQGQVECLIDMATDLDILGRAWVGWMSWV